MLERCHKTVEAVVALLRQISAVKHFMRCMFCWRGAVQANQGPRKTQNPALLPKGQPQVGGESLLKESVSIGADAAN